MKTKSPERDKAFKLYIKSGKTLKCKDIAEKLNVSTSLVSKWKSQDKWDSEPLPKDTPKSKKNTKSKSKQKGGQKGNINAIGNGAPNGNDNNLKHGGYSQVYWDALDDEEKLLIETMPKSEEDLLIDQIKLFSVRERRIMLAIQKVKESGPQSLTEVTRIEDKRAFAGDDEKALYDERIKEKVEQGERLPGTKYRLITNTENTQNVINRLESELTRVQRAKNQAIDSLAKLSIEKQKLELLKESRSEIEDTDDIDGELYGENSL